MGSARRRRHVALAARVGALVLVASSALAQTWTLEYGAELHVADARSVPSGGFVAVGDLTSPAFPEDLQGAVVLRYDDAGNTLWQVALGSPRADYFDAVVPLVDGTFAAVGARVDPATHLSLSWFVRLDASGNVMWERTWDGPTMTGFRASPASDGGVFAAVTLLNPDRPASSIDLNCALRISPAGDPEWLRCAEQTLVGGAQCGCPVDVAGLDDGGVVLAGTAYDGSAGDWQQDVWRLASDGTPVWGRVLGRSDRDDLGGSVSVGADGRIVVAAGESDSRAPSNDSWVAWLDDTGAGTRQLEWTASVSWADDVVLAAGPPAVIRGVDASGSATFLALVEEADALTWVRSQDPLGVTDIVPGGGFVAIPGRYYSAGVVARLDAAGLSDTDCVSPVDVTIAPRFVAPDVAPTPRHVLDMPVVFDAVSSWKRDPGLVGDCARACTELVCGEVLADPPEPCEGDLVTLTWTGSGGEGTVAVEWDLDGDGSADRLGNPTTLVVPAGASRITATVTDECPDGAQTCVSELALSPPPALPEVSNVLGGAPPLRVLPGRGDVVVERVTEATAYHVHVGRLGEWYAPEPALGDRCAFPGWIDGGDGTVTLPAALPVPGAWVVVSAAHACGEGPAGRDSFGVAREDGSGWAACGAAP